MPFYVFFQVLVGIEKMNGEIFLDFDVNKLLHADALSVFVNIFNEMNLKDSIYEASITLLIRLGMNRKLLIHAILKLIICILVHDRQRR